LWFRVDRGLRANHNERMNIKLKNSLKIGNLTAANRLVMPPLVIWQSDESGLVSENHKTHYKRCSKGAGYTIVEATVVSPEGKLAATQLGIYEDSHLEGLTDLARIIKENGSLAGIQIHHAGGTAKKENIGGLTPLVPSLSVFPEGFDARELTGADIDRIIQDFAKAAERAVKAGFDIIELHGAHGYLIAQFLSPKKNQRTDKYGGTPENRRRFLTEVVEAVKKAVNGQALLSIRLGVADDPIPVGEPYMTLEEGVATARLCEELGMDILDISCSHGADPAIKPENSEWSSLIHHGMAVKKAVSIPVIGVGGIKEPEQAARLIADGSLDMVAVGKGILADPDWFVKAIKEEPVYKCFGCKRCLWFKKEKLANCPAWKKRGEIPFV
jgi:NADPH2 dehydrogenase